MNTTDSTKAAAPAALQMPAVRPWKSLADPMVLLIAASFFTPLYFSEGGVSNFAYCLIWTFAAIGLAAMWGFGGILSFGQTAFSV